MKNPMKDALMKRRLNGLDLTIMIAPGKPEIENENEDEGESEEGEDAEMAPEVMDKENEMEMLNDERMPMSPLRKKVLGK